MKRLLKVGLPVVVVVFGVWLFSRQWTLTVPVAEVERGLAVNAVTGTVEVWAYADIHVKAQNRGVITENPVAAGDRVEVGDVVAVQESDQLRLQIEQVEIRLEAARAREKLESTHRIDLESLAERIQGLELAVELKQRPASDLEDLRREQRKKEVLRQLEDIQQRESRRLLENQLAQLSLQMEQMSTRAPFAGTIAAINAFKGDLVNGGQNLVRLVSHGRYLIMELTEEDYFGVEDGQTVTLRLASYPDRTFEGKVSRLADVANANNKTRNVIVTVEAPDEVLVPGLSGEGYLVKAERENAILIPRRALIGNLVYVVSNGVVEVRRVQPGFLGLNKAEIRKGLEEGEQVVLEDQNLLKPGDRVTTAGASSP